MPVVQPPLPIAGMTTEELPAINPPVNTCPCCGDEIAEGEGIVVEEYDNPVCSECTHTCDNCRRTTTAIVAGHNTGHARRNSVPSIMLCEQCRRECADCARIFRHHVDGSENSEGDWICDRCAENYGACGGCGDTFHYDDLQYGENSDISYCERCFPDNTEEDMEGGIHPYTFTPKPIFFMLPNEQYQKDRNLVYYGLEIECENVGNQNTKETVIRAIENYREWYAKEDGSLNNGAEIVSHPGTWSYWKAHNFGWAATLRKARFRSYDTATAGMHVHISRAAFTDLGIFKMMYFFKHNKELIEKFARRDTARWANIDGGPEEHRLSQKVIILCPASVYGPKSVQKRRWKHDDRYAAINLAHANTVEIRIFRGTLSVAGIKRNLALCVAFTHFVRYASLRQLTGCDFVRWMNEHAGAILGKVEAADSVRWVTSQIDPKDTNC